MVSEQITFAALSWASWSSIFAGSVTALALSMILAMLGVALGFTVLNPKSDEPASGMGVAFGVWTFISLVVSTAGGGFIAGLFAGQHGMEHGFLAWAVVAIAGSLFGSLAVGSALRTVGSVFKSMGSGAASAVSTVGKGAVDAASHVVSELRDNVHLSMDANQLNEDVTDVLRDTGIDSLQPEYLKKQVREAGADLRSALRQLALKPGNAEEIISRFMAKEKSRLDSFTRTINKDDAVNALMRARSLPRDEAETMVNNALSAYNRAVEKAKDSLADARDQVEEARQHLKDMAEEARIKADKMAKAAAKAALAAAMAMILAAAVGMYAGHCGVKYASNIYTAEATYMYR